MVTFVVYCVVCKSKYSDFFENLTAMFPDDIQFSIVCNPKTGILFERRQKFYILKFEIKSDEKDSSKILAKFLHEYYINFINSSHFYQAIDCGWHNNKIRVVEPKCVMVVFSNRNILYAFGGEDIPRQFGNAVNELNANLVFI